MTLPRPPNRTGGSPASGSPVSGFVNIRWSASTRAPLPRTAAHGAQTIRSASVDAPLPGPSLVHPSAIAADSAVVVSRSRPRVQTCWLCCAGNTHQCEPDPVCWLTRCEPRQPALGPDRAFHPPPRVAGFSGLLRCCHHWRRFEFVVLDFHASTFLRPFAPRSLPASPLLRTL